MATTVNKPWGKEVWIELNDKYCYKIIHINAGHRTSFQYHEKKLETSCVVSGEVELWLEDDNGNIQKAIKHAGDSYTVRPYKKHRVIAITDVTVYEVSTPEVEDVIRVEDDSNRQNGRIDHEYIKPAACIMAAGLGTRLMHMTKNINKALLPIENKAVISHIIEKIPTDYDIVIAIGFKAELIKEYCLAAHPDRNITFVKVDKYEGKGTGPGYSISACRDHLQRPFYIFVADCYLEDKLPSLDGDWLGVTLTGIPEIYATVKFDEKCKVVDFKNKCSEGFDYAYTGIASIVDYKTFWNQLDKELVKGTGELVGAFYDPSAYSNMHAKIIKWHDIGTVENYLGVLKKFTNQYNLTKVSNEFMYRVNNKVIKLITDNETATKKISRGKILGNLIPEFTFCGEYIYAYNWIEGDEIYNANDESVWKDFLDWCKNNLWFRANTNYNIHDDCIEFYQNKTEKRLLEFMKARNSSYGLEHVVNGEKCKSIFDYLDSIDWEYLSNGIPTRLFHGDLHFANSLYDGNKFYLIDWRDSFSPTTEYGDVYYDLAKFYGGLLMSYANMKDPNNYSVHAVGNEVKYSYNVSNKLQHFKKYFENWAKQNGFDIKKIKLITSLIYLNMAPLHDRDFGDLLFFKSKQMLKNIFK